MAFASQPYTGASLGARFNAFWTELLASRARYSQYQRTRSELEAMSDRDLADLGISRSDIHDIAAQHLAA